MIEVRRGPLGLPGGEVLDPLAGTPVSLSRPLSLIAGGVQGRRARRRPVRRRGLRRLEPPALIVRDMLELASATEPGDGKRAGAARAAADRTGQVERARRGDGRRAPTPARPTSRWRRSTSTACDRTGPERRPRGSTGRRSPAAPGCSSGGCAPTATPGRWSCSTRAAPGPREHLDAAVRAAASLTLELARQRRLPRAAARRAPRRSPSSPTSRAGPDVHTRLALVEGGPADTRHRRSRRAPGSDRCSTWPRRPLDRLPAALAGVGAAACVLVLPAELVQRTTAGPSFEVVRLPRLRDPLARRAQRGSGPHEHRRAGRGARRARRAPGRARAQS